MFHRYKPSPPNNHFRLNHTFLLPLLPWINPINEKNFYVRKLQDQGEEGGERWINEKLTVSHVVSTVEVAAAVR